MHRKIIIILLLSFIATTWGFSDEPPTELRELREQIEALTLRLKQLEERYETDKKMANEEKRIEEEQSVKEPQVTLDGKGFRVRSADEDFELRIRLRLAQDFAWFDQDNELKNQFGNEQDGTDFRFARIRLQGRLWEDFRFLGEFDFAGQNGGDTPKFRDMYIQYNGIPYIGENEFDLRFGHFKEPFSLDELNAVTSLQFLENPLLDVFVPSRNAGLQLSDAILGESKAERMTWAVGVFKETDDIPSSDDSDEDQGYQLTGRITGLPIYADGGRKLLHLGAEYSHRNRDGDFQRYRPRPETRLSNFRYVDTGNIAVDEIDLLGLELAGVYGPFSLQSEYVRSDLNAVSGEDLCFDGYYVQIAYLLTGEHRSYRHDSGRFDSPVPKHPFHLSSEKWDWGAWEIASRYGAVDLNDGNIDGGKHTSLTLGLNWYLNTNLRVSANYIHNDIDNNAYDGQFDVYQTRMQLEF